MYGFAFCRGKEEYCVLLIGGENSPVTIDIFLQEMLHIYHNDFESNLLVGQIEERRQGELIEILEMLMKERGRVD